MIFNLLTYLFFFGLFIRFLVVLYNFITNPVLKYFPNTIDISQISVLIPARNEEINIEILLKSLLKSNVLEIIVCDDNSTDKTRQVIDNQLLNNSKINVFTGLPLPKDWLGKNWACHQLAQKANGKYVLFLDADVEITPSLFSNALHQMNNSNVSILSLFPDQRMKTLSEKLIVPLMHYLLLSLLPLRLVKTSKQSSLSAANGQFIFFEKSVYLKFNFHELVKSNILDDVNIVIIAKNNDIKCETLLANKQIFCRMYDSFDAGIQGFSKNLYLGFGKNIIGISIYFVFILWGYFFIFLSNNIFLIMVSLLFILIQRIFISILSNQSIIQNLIFHPIQLFFYQLIAIQSIYKHTFGKIYWKNRTI